MILQALVEYYDRKAADPDLALAPGGFEWKEIPFILELDANGMLVQIVDTREFQAKKLIAKRFLVPQAVKKTSGVAANLFWDTAEYVLGFDLKGKPERAIAQRAAFIERITSLESIQQDDGVRAVLTFLNNPESVKSIEANFTECYKKLLEINPVMSFRMAGEVNLVCQRTGVVAGLKGDGSVVEPDGFCLVRGEEDNIERLHTSIKGVWGAQSSGANIVSF